MRGFFMSKVLIVGASAGEILAGRAEGGGIRPNKQQRSRAF